MGLHEMMVRKVFFPMDLCRLGEGKTLSYWKELERSQYFDAEALQQLQAERLRRLLHHAYSQCDFYRQRFEQASLLPTDIKSAEDMQTLPILEKRDIQQHGDTMVARNHTRATLLRDQTGGSTGEPISFRIDLDRKCSRHAAALRHNSWSGWRVGDKVAHVWGATPDIPQDSIKQRIRNSVLDRCIYLDTASVTEAAMRQFVRQLERFRPKIIHAYARSLSLLARFVKDNRLSAWSPHGIVTSAEVLSCQDRKLIEEVFGCRVFNRYGCREFGVIASECEEHDGLHMTAESLLVEVVGEDSPNGVGSVLVTDLLNYAMPMIRYRIGDMARLMTDHCACGRSLPRLAGVEGRVTDFLVGTDGQLVSGVFLATYVLAQRPSLGQVQLFQEQAGKVLYRFTGSGAPRDLDADIEFLRNATRRYLGKTAVVDTEIVESLSNEASGKLSYCRSLVTADFVA